MILGARRVVGLALVLTVAGLPARGQVPAGGPEHDPVKPVVTASRTVHQPEYKLVFWFESARPVETFRYHAYDLRKGEFNQKVQDWLTLVERQYPHYEAYARNIHLEQEKGETDAAKIQSVVSREIMVTATYYRNPINEVLGVDFAQPGPAPARPSPARSSLSVTTVRGYRQTYSPWSNAPARLPLRPLPSMYPSPGAGGLRGGGGLSPLFPVPYPYPRPHP